MRFGNPDLKGSFVREGMHGALLDSGECRFLILPVFSHFL